mmetsp:Transcript_2794/g.3545  ORF Transcript_2794/g.3545 Transcript_2794/m.3545 type:complete len:86 (+) Transcript_2794:1772-2029(+)
MVTQLVGNGFFHESKTDLSSFPLRRSVVFCSESRNKTHSKFPILTLSILAYYCHKNNLLIFLSHVQNVAQMLESKTTNGWMTSFV